MRTYCLNVPYTHRDIASMCGARWNPEHRLFTFKGNELHPDLVSYRSRPFSWGAHVERQLNNEEPPVIIGKHTLTPRKDQLEGISMIQEAYQQGSPGFLLADEMGLGKTLVAWDAVNSIMPEGSRIAIVTPLSVIGSWVATLEDRGVNGQDVIILNYEKLRVFFDTSDVGKTKTGKSKARTLKGVAKHGEMKSVDCLIFDESQRVKNPASARAKLAALLAKDAQFITWISGTPGQNPLELAYLLPILRYKTEGIKTGECTAEELERWAAKQKLKLKRGAYGKWEWDQEGNEDKILADILFNSKTKPRVAIHRVPSDIIGWPEVQRILHPFELDDEEETQYKRSWEELRSAVLNTPLAARSKAQSPAMVALIRFRQKASLIRVPKTVDLAEDMLENGHQVAISCEFLDTIRAFEEAFLKLKIKTTTVTGAQQDPMLRQTAIDRFNKGEAQVILFTVTEGINLQENVSLTKDKPRTQIDHEIRWSGLAMSQVDARCHRNGKYARVYWTYAKGTVEEDVIQRVLLRLKGIENIVGDDRQLAKEIEDQLLHKAAK